MCLTKPISQVNPLIGQRLLVMVITKVVLPAPLGLDNSQRYTRMHWNILY
ncbi:hypothetical protein [Bacillus cereus]